MSQQSVEQFYSLAIQDGVIRQRLTSAPNQDSLAEIAVQIGKEKGFDFTLEDAKAKLVEINSADELSDEQLEAVAGGKGDTINNNYGSKQNAVYTTAKVTVA